LFYPKYITWNMFVLNNVCYSFDDLHHLSEEKNLWTMEWHGVTFTVITTVISVFKIWLSWTWQHYCRNLLCWSDWKISSGTQTRKLNCGVMFHKTMNLLIYHHKCYPKCSIIHHIHQTWPPVTVSKLKEFIKDQNLLMMRMLSTLRVAGWRTKIKSFSTVESGLWNLMLDQV